MACSPEVARYRPEPTDCLPAPREPASAGLEGPAWPGGLAGANCRSAGSAGSQTATAGCCLTGPWQRSSAQRPVSARWHRSKWSARADSSSARIPRQLWALGDEKLFGVGSASDGPSGRTEICNWNRWLQNRRRLIAPAIRQALQAARQEMPARRRAARGIHDRPDIA
jgi:hypothetical protein